MHCRYKQGQVVFLKNPNELPDGKALKHPVLIISSNRSNRHDSGGCRYTGVMITHSKQRDAFSFPIIKGYTTRHDDEHSQVRKHLIFGFNESDIFSLVNSFENKPFSNLIKEIKEDVFCID